MNLQIVALSGPQGGKVFQVIVGHRIGRRKVEILLEDSKASNRHAQFIEVKGQLFLKDLESKNGLWVGGQRVNEVHLIPGAIFVIGNSEFRVEEASQVSRAGAFNSAPPEKAPLIVQMALTPASVMVPESKPEEQRTETHLEKFLKRVLTDLEDRQRVLVPFDPPLTLRFIRGLQTDHEWRITYGPRSCGSHSLDLTLFEPEAPALCFELLPTPRGIALKTSHGDIVKVNDVSGSTHVLENGDLITILNSCLEVELK